MFNQLPYDTLAKRIAGINEPFLQEKFANIFRDISNETSVENVQQIDIQNDLCNIFLISPKGISEKYRPVPPTYFFYNIQALLILGDERFYMLIHLGNDPIITNHTFNQTIASMRLATDEFVKISSGRFTNKATNIIISAEEDEFDTKYILLTNSEWLLNANEIFSFSRNFFNI